VVSTVGDADWGLWVLARTTWISVLPALVLGCLLAVAGPAWANGVFVSDPDGEALSQFSSGANGALSALSPASVADGYAPAGIAVTPNGANLYAADGAYDNGNFISQFSIFNGALSPLSPATVGADDTPGEVAISPDGKYLYVGTNLGGGSISQYSIGANGALSPLSPASVDLNGVPAGIAVAPNGKYLYAAVPFTGGPSDAIWQFSIGAGGALAPLTPATVAAGGPTGLAVSPNSQNLYALGPAGNGAGVYQYSISTDGALSPLSPAIAAYANQDGAPSGVSANEIVVSPNGRNVYLTEIAPGDISLANEVSQYSVGAGGALSLLSPAGVATGAGPAGIAISPNGQNVYVANNSDGTVSQYSVGDGSGGLSPLSPATVPAGMDPVELAVSPSPLATTSTSVSSSVNPSSAGQSVTFTAAVGRGSATAVPSGSVTFEDGSTTLGTGTLSGANASFTTSSLSVGTHAISAVYSGDSNFAGSTSSPLSQTVTAGGGAGGGGGGGGGQGQPTTTLLGHPTSTGASVSDKLTCHGASGQSCAITEQLTSTETTSNGTPVAVSARARHNAKRRTVIVAIKKVTLEAGRSAAITITLNATGKRLLKRFGKLPVTLTITLSQNGKQHRVAKRGLTLKPAKRK
jgi:DNA-binding beta-propeller fold protein YncE